MFQCCGALVKDVRMLALRRYASNSVVFFYAYALWRKKFTGHALI
jgi:hypothetical protein